MWASGDARRSCREVDTLTTVGERGAVMWASASGDDRWPRCRVDTLTTVEGQGGAVMLTPGDARRSRCEAVTVVVWDRGSRRLGAKPACLHRFLSADYSAIFSSCGIRPPGACCDGRISLNKMHKYALADPLFQRDGPAPGSFYPGRLCMVCAVCPLMVRVDRRIAVVDLRWTHDPSSRSPLIPFDGARSHERCGPCSMGRPRSPS